MEPGAAQSGGIIKGVETFEMDPATNKPKVKNLPTAQEWKDWDDYMNRAIQDPNADIVKGFPRGVMPNFTSQLDGTAYNIAKRHALIEYIKTLSDRYIDEVKAADPNIPTPPPAPGRNDRLRPRARPANP